MQASASARTPRIVSIAATAAVVVAGAVVLGHPAERIAVASRVMASASMAGE